MTGQLPAVTLKRRLIGHYLMFGLLGLFFCLLTTLLVCFYSQWNWLVPIAALLSVLVLASGTMVVSQLLKYSSEVESQLISVAKDTRSTDIAVKKITGKEASVEGWNRLVDKLSHHDNWSRLEERLSSAVTNSQSEQHEQVFQRMPVPIAITDASNELVMFNEAFCSHVEIDPGSLKSKSIFEAIKINQAANSEEILSQLSAFQGSLNADMRNGKELDEGVIRISRSPIVLENDVAEHHIWILRDVTQQLLAEEMRNQFVFTATHELRTPLGNIKAYAEMLQFQDGIDIEKQKEFYNIITNESNRLLRFVDELLNINQMEAGSMSIYRHEVDSESLLENVIHHVQPEMDKKGIEFDRKLPAKWPTLDVDKEKIESALVNLLGNAAKYTPENGRVCLKIIAKDNQFVAEVEDSGIGISEEELGKIFDKFFRSQDERVRDITGNGLGLAYTQEVARLHGGRLEVQSELNKGSRFTLILPLK